MYHHMTFEIFNYWHEITAGSSDKIKTHTPLEGVKILLQFSNDETWWALKSTFSGLKKILF